MKEISPGPNPPEEIFVFVEIPEGCQNKYEFDEKLRVFKLDRTLHSPLHYPADYGHIPSTLCEDGDPLDVLVLVTEPTFPGCVIEARPIGAIEMEDEKGLDDKILAVPVHDPRFDHVKDIKDISQHTLKEITHFFEMYKALEPNKWVKIKGWLGAKEAKEKIKKAIQLYKEKKS
jgi:inorganic pyrophosphatase